MDISKYIDVFDAEAQEFLQTLNEALLVLEKDPNNLHSVEELFRAAHTLKGISATMGFDQIADLTHKMENLVDKIRKKERKVSPSLIDLLFRCFDVLQELLEEISTGQKKGLDVASLVERLEVEESTEVEEVQLSEAKGKKEPSLLTASEKQVLEEAQKRGFRTFKIRVFLEEGCLLKGTRAYMVFKNLTELGEVIKSTPSIQDLEDEKFGLDFEVIFVSKESSKRIKSSLMTISEIKNVEVSSFTLKTEELGQGVAPATEALPKIEKTQTVRVNIGHLDNLMNLVGELVINKARLDRISFGYELTELDEVLGRLKMITNDLQNEVMQARMVPIGQIFNRFPRMVRDIAHDQGKEVNFVMEGTDIELDRTVLDEIGDSLMHLLRNAVGHGIEPPEERERLGKSREGRVSLIARREKNNVIIEVVDDGQGIDPSIIRETAIKRGFVSRKEAEALSDVEAVELICLPGFTIAKEATSLAGRGVGVDVVKTQVEALGGSLEIISRVGKGSKFVLKLPLTLAIIQALLVQVTKEIYAIPLANIVEIVEVPKSGIRTIQGGEVIVLHDRVVPLLHLREIFGFDLGEELPKNDMYIVIVGIGETVCRGLVVDALIGQQEIVIKPLSEMLKGLKGLGGVTILGDGRVAFILDVRSLPRTNNYKEEVVSSGERD